MTNDTLYQFEIPNTKRKTYLFFAYAIFGINAAAALFFSYYKDSSKNFYILLAAVVGIIIMLIAILYKSDLKIKKSATVFMFVFGIIIWLKNGMYWGAAINTALLFLHLNAIRNLIITISHEYISYPSYPVKKIIWNEVQNIVLKDGLLTIDQKNNKMIQHEVMYHEDKIQEKDFNQLCASFIQK